MIEGRAEYQAANAIRVNDYERDLVYINMPLVFMMLHCRLSWVDRKMCADAMQENNRACKSLADERDMLMQDGGKAGGAAMQQRQAPDERSLRGST